MSLVRASRILRKVAELLVTAAAKPIKATRNLLGYTVEYDAANFAPGYKPYWLTSFTHAGWQLERALTDLRLTNRKEWYTVQCAVFVKNGKVAMFFRGSTPSKTGLRSRVYADQIYDAQAGDIGKTLKALDKAQWKPKDVRARYKVILNKFPRSIGAPNKKSKGFEYDLGIAIQPKDSADARAKLERMGVKVISVGGATKGETKSQAISKYKKNSTKKFVKKNTSEDDNWGPNVNKSSSSSSSEAQWGADF